MDDAGQSRHAEAGIGRRFLTFRVDQHRYALPAAEISEVIRIPPVARIPQSPKGLLGVANLRGSVLPVASLRALLGREPKIANQSARAIVLDGAEPVALTVDAVDALISLDAEPVETRQAELATEPGELLRGAFRPQSHQDPVKILDIQGLLAAAFVQRARPTRAAAIARGRGLVPESDESGPIQQMLVTFDVAGQEYALNAASVREILSAPDATAFVPRAEALVLGVAAFRGTLLPLLSLRGLLGFDRADVTDRREKIIVTAVAGVLVGLVADRMRAIVRADPQLIDPTPSILAARTGGETTIKAIYRGDGGRRLISILAPDQLFREDVMQRLGNSGEAPGPQRDGTEQRQGENAQFLVFRLGEEEFGLPIESVDEVARVPEQITRIPKTPKFLEGVVNLRGEVLPVVDQRRRFDLPKFTGQRERQRLIVVRTERHRAALIVDSVSEVLRAAREAIEPAPDLTGETTRLVHGVINLEAAGRMVLLLDPAELLSRTERRLLDAFERRRAQASVIKLLVIDDSALMRKLLGKIFDAEPDFEVRFARDGVDGLDQLATYAPDVVTLDVNMPQMNGLQCLDRIMIERPCPVVMVSSQTAAGAEATLEALKLGAVDFIPKPDGAVSLGIDELAPQLVAKVRAAAGAQIRTSLRLKERVRHRLGSHAQAKRRATEAAARMDRLCPVAATGEGLVLVGTSTGGPPALEALLIPLPATFPWPILVAQHMPASFTGPLARRLDRLCALSVVEVTQPMPLQPGCAYIGRGDADIVVSRRAAGLIAMPAPARRDYPWHPSTDRLVRSAMEHVVASQLIGVLMTGMGNDGAGAMTQLHMAGGKTIAEAEETAVVWGMPGELVKAGGADWVLPLSAIASRLRQLTP